MENYEIETGEELTAAFKRLDIIWSARPGDEDWDERVILVDSIEKFENENVEIKPIENDKI